MGGQWRRVIVRQGTKPSSLEVIDRTTRHKAEILALRSERDELRDHLAFFLRATPKSEKVRVGYDKRVLRSPAHRKIYALDHAYIRTNDVVVSLIRIDLDKIFKTEAALIKAIREALPRSCWPALLVGSIAEDGRVHGCHAYWYLEAPVPFSKNGRAGPKAIYHAAMRRLVSALHKCGADPGCISNPFHGKNPLCDIWDLMLLEEGEPRMVNLETICDQLKSANSTEVLIRQAAELAYDDANAPEARQQSNQLFNSLRRFAKHNIGRFRENGHPYADFEEEVVAYALEQVRGLRTKESAERAAQKIGKSVAAFCWKHADTGDDRRRGAIRHLIEESMGLPERQALGGRYAAGVKRDKSAEAIRTAVSVLEARGEAVTKAAVAKVVQGVSRKTVYNRLDDVLNSPDAGSPAPETAGQALRSELCKSVSDKKGVSYVGESCPNGRDEALIKDTRNQSDGGKSVTIRADESDRFSVEELIAFATGAAPIPEAIKRMIPTLSARQDPEWVRFSWWTSARLQQETGVPCWGVHILDETAIEQLCSQRFERAKRMVENENEIRRREYKRRVMEGHTCIVETDETLFQGVRIPSGRRGIR